jgi:hypothetical protein
MRFNFPDPGEARVIELHGRRLWRFEDGTIIPYVAGGFEGEGGDGGGTGGQGGSGGTGGAGGEGGSGSGGSGSGGSGAQGAAGGGGGDDDLGFPANTPWRDMTAPEQAAYWRHQAKKHESRANARADYDEVKAKAQKYDALDQASKTEHERAIETAKEEAVTATRAEERQKAAVKVVRAEMRAAAAGRLDADKLEALLEPVDMTKFLDAEGEVDTDKVASFIATVAPADGGKGDGKTRRGPDLGQGRRGGESGGDNAQGSIQSGRDRYRSRHGQRQSTTA